MGPKARRRAAARAALAAPRSLLLLLVGFFVGKAAAVDLTSVALVSPVQVVHVLYGLMRPGSPDHHRPSTPTQAGLASIPELPEVDMNAMARGITYVACPSLLVCVYT